MPAAVANWLYRLRPAVARLSLIVQSKTPLKAELTAKDKESAEKLKSKLEEAVKVTTGHLKELASRHKPAAQASAILNSLEFEIDEAVVRISSKEEAAGQLPEILIDFMMNN